MNNRPVILLGMGGHAKVCMEILNLLGVDVLGSIALKEGQKIDKLTYLGSDEQLLSYSSDSVLLVNGVGHIPYSNQRRKIYESYKNKGYQFMTLIHPEAVVASNAVLGEGVQVMAGTVIQPHTFIGQNSILNTSSIIEHDCRIGSHSHLAPRVTLCGTTKVSDDVYIGAATVVLPNLSIGKDALIGAGSVVLNDVPSKERFIQKKERSIL